MKLHTYSQSSASYRVRIALNLKGITTEQAYHDLAAGAHLVDGYEKVNPQKLVPSLEIDGDILTQSLAIMEYLEETQPTPALLPKDLVARAHARAIALAISSDISPINNRKVRLYLKSRFGATDEDVKVKWIQHWIADGFTALEALLARSKHTGNFCVGDFPTIADCCLVPQMFNAKRFDLDLTPYPAIVRIVDACEKLPAFINAHPLKQADAA